MSESQVRYQCRSEYRDEGTLDGYKKFPKGSQERLWYVDEAQKIKSEYEWSAIH
jgi:hypothetical protein